LRDTVSTSSTPAPIRAELAFGDDRGQARSGARRRDPPGDHQYAAAPPEVAPRVDGVSGWCLGHDPSAQILCVSYAQDLADKLSRDCRHILTSDWYRQLFATRLSAQRQAASEFETTAQCCRLATSVGGVLTGRGADIIIIDDPLKPEEALSQAQRQASNEWHDHTLYSRLNDTRTGSIVLIMHRLHESLPSGLTRGTILLATCWRRRTAVTRYQPQSDKIMRMHAQTAMIENGFVHLPKEAAWLAEYLHELTVFPKGKHDEQVDSTAQMLD
jgi:predicted phage terminase large subunit-like protein